jgi:hypothetical protein
MDTWFKGMVFAAIGGLVLTALSVLIIDEESVFMYTWGFPVPYFEKLYPDAIGSHGGVFIWWTQALFDFAFWFLLCTVAVGAIGLAGGRGKHPLMGQNHLHTATWINTKEPEKVPCLARNQP